MSIQAINWAYGVTTGSPSAKLVLVCLAEHANKDGLCWPSVARIAAQCELSRKGVQRQLAILVQRNLITRMRRSIAGASTSNIYQLQGVQVTQGGVTDTQGVASPGRTNRKTEPSIEPRDSLFLEFWLAYPRKTGKAETQQAYSQALELTDHSTILAGVGRYAHEVRACEPEFIRYPAKWLQWRGWEDGLDEAVPA